LANKQTVTKIEHILLEHDAAVRLPAGVHYAEPLLIEADSRNVHIELEEGAQLNVQAFVLAVDTAVNLTLTIDMTGKHAELNLHGLFIASGSGSAGIDIKVNHRVSDCHSRQLINGIATGTATGSFDGMVHVARDAQRTDATQQNRNLQITDTAHIFIRPQLEIYADDVKCSHGATIGRLDEEAVYYMRQRGISESEARRMQLKGFTAEIVNHCQSESFRNSISERIDEIISGF
jgi:Fe-S cluster assembly protein SufD